MIERIHHGQRYTAVDGFDRARKDGTTARIIWWLSDCAECGAPFRFTTPEKSEKFAPVRRCPEHRKPGVRVRQVHPSTRKVPE